MTCNTSTMVTLGVPIRERQMQGVEARRGRRAVLGVPVLPFLRDRFERYGNQGIGFGVIAEEVVAARVVIGMRVVVMSAGVHLGNAVSIDIQELDLDGTAVERAVQYDVGRNLLARVVVLLAAAQDRDPSDVLSRAGCPRGKAQPLSLKEEPVALLLRKPKTMSHAEPCGRPDQENGQGAWPDRAHSERCPISPKTM